MSDAPPVNSLDVPRFCGVPTFMRLPLAGSLDGLDAAVIGLPSDSVSPFRTGARFGPNAIRAMSVMLRPINPYRGNLNVFERLRVERIVNQCAHLCVRERHVRRVSGRSENFKASFFVNERDATAPVTEFDTRHKNHRG